MEKKRKMEIIDEKAPEEPEPKKQQQQEADEPYTESSSGVEVSDSGIYDAIRSCLSDDQLLFDNISSIKDFRKSQRVKKITAQPRWKKDFWLKTSCFVKCNRHLADGECEDAEEHIAIDNAEANWR